MLSPADFAEPLKPAPPEGCPLVIATPEGWDREPPPEVEWLVEGLLPRGVTGILGGRSNSGKSLLALAMTMSITSGFAFMGLPTRQGSILFVELEDGQNSVRRRFHRALELFREDPNWTPDHEAALMRNWRLCLPVRGQKHDLANLVPTLIEQGQGCALVVIDTLNAVAAGDENAAEVQAAFWAAAYELTERTGATVMILHHSRKAPGGSRLSMSDRLSFDSLRGSTAIVAGARAILQIEALTPQEAERSGLDPERAHAGNYVVLALTKNNEGPKGEWFVLEQRQAHEVGAGFFVPLRNGDEVAAGLRSRSAKASFTFASRVLASIAEGVTNRGELVRRHWPGDPNGPAILKTTLANLRRRHGWLEPRSLVLTKSGREHVDTFLATLPQESEY